MSPPVIVAAYRTAIGTAGRGPLAQVGIDRLAAPVLRALADRLDPVAVQQVILGNCTGPGGNPARVAALAADLGIEVPARTVDQQCGSGLEAVMLAAGLIESGRADAVVAGGVESPSTAPVRSVDGVSYTRARFAPEPYPDPEMGEAAEDLARRAAITRERQDEYAARSHARAVRAIEDKRFVDEIVPVAGVDTDDRPRSGMTVARLARLPAAFPLPGDPARSGKRGPVDPRSTIGTVTAGNSCGVNDGAAAVAVVAERLRAARDLPGLRICDWALTGCDPALPGLGPVGAIRELLDRQGLELDDIDAIEIVESFAGQVLACADALDLDPERICADGGAIALGHPWAASGAILLVRLFTRLVRQDGPDLGLAALAIGGGMGAAVLVERTGPRCR